MKVKLVQWPGTDLSLSIFPRCNLFQYILQLGGVDYEIENVQLPTPGDNFKLELMDKLLNTPVLYIDDKAYTDSTIILDALLKEVIAPDKVKNLKNLVSASGLILEQWGNNVFLNSLVYSRWVKVQNFEKFTAQIKWDEPVPQQVVNTVRLQIIRYLKKELLTNLDEKGFDQYVKKQFWSLQFFLEDYYYFSKQDAYPDLSDLYIFMVVDGFFNGELEESEDLMHSYPQIYKWYLRMLKYIAISQKS